MNSPEHPQKNNIFNMKLKSKTALHIWVVCDIPKDIYYHAQEILHNDILDFQSNNVSDHS